jgi:hypothetical protein
MTIDQFRKDRELVQWLNSLLGQERFRVLLDALDEGHPRHYRENIKGLPESDNSVKLGVIYGYDEFRNNLMSCATFAVEIEPLQSTFTKPEPDG